jgi:hypothetical protein
MRDDERLVIMPILARGSHTHPRRGGCFAEVAAVLSTHRWADHPGCLPPLLGHLARQVNDRVGPHARLGLAPLIPWAVFPLRPLHDVTGDRAVTDVLIRFAHAAHLADPEVEALVQRVQRAPRPRHPLERMTWRHAGRRLANAELAAFSTAAHGTEREERLRDVLIAGIDAVRAADDLPPMPQRMDVPGRCPQPLPVTTALASVDEIFELHVEPLLDDWPDWLRDPWLQRRTELSGTVHVTGGEDGPTSWTGRHDALPV